MSALPILTVTLNPAIDQTLSIDNFAAGRVNRVAGEQSHPGGKGVNVAVMLADLGASVVATGWLGSRNAEAFQLLFAKKRIDDQFLRVPGETRLGIKIIDEALGETTDINFPGLRIPPSGTDDLAKRVAALVQPGQWVVLAGSVPPGADTGLYGLLIDIVRVQGGRIAVDTSGEALREALSHAPDLAKPNVAELAELVGRPLTEPGEIIAAARSALLDRGVKLAVVSMGADGAMFVTNDAALRTRAPAVPVKSTVGAGDAMVAGLVYALSQDMPLADAARLATALGTYAVTHVASGSEDGGYRQYVDQIAVEDLK